MNSMLNNIRVLDLTNEKGFLCGRILGDLGADVIKFEKPGGDSSRNIGPYYHNQPDPEKSLYWFGFNANKRGITLDIEKTIGQEIFFKLMASADIVLESFEAGYMDSIGLSYQALRQIKPSLIMTSITPYGYNTRRSKYQASDLVSTAASSFLWIVGDPDRPPVRISFPQAYLHAGAQAAAATMVARRFQQRTGQGQFVDVSIQASLIPLTVNTIPWWALHSRILHREGQYRAGVWGANSRGIWRCKDGFVTFLVGGGPRYSHWNKMITLWMAEEGMADDLIKGIDWDNFDILSPRGFTMADIEERIARFFLKHTKAELYQWGVKNAVGIYPAYSIKDIPDDPQLKERHFWVKVHHPELQENIIYPASFVRATETACEIRRRAPLIGEHNRDIYQKELGFSDEKMAELKQKGII